MPLAYFITFRTYGTWLHGDERGSVSRGGEREFGEPGLPPDPVRESVVRGWLKSQPVTLNKHQRAAVLNVITEVCATRGWALLATNVRTNHVHVVVSGNVAPEKIMNDLKAYATRSLRAIGPIEKPWSRHGSTRFLWTDDQVADACEYVLNGQGADLGGVARRKRHGVSEGGGNS